MKCPVCQTINADNADLCKECHSDLEIYRQLDSIDSNISNKKRTVILLSTLIGFLVLGGSAAFVNLNEAPGPKPMVQTDAMAVLESQNRELRAQLDVSDGEADKLRLELKEALAREAGDESLVDQKPKAAVTKAKTPSISSAQEKKAEPELLDPNVKMHEFQEGETLWSLARQECGSGQRYDRIMKDNDITDPKQVKPGTKLKIYCE